MNWGQGSSYFRFLSFASQNGHSRKIGQRPTTALGCKLLIPWYFFVFVFLHPISFPQAWLRLAFYDFMVFEEPDIARQRVSERNSTIVLISGKAP